MGRLMMANGSGSKDRRGRQYWENQIELWRRSGLNRSAFCRQHQLSRWGLRYWEKKLLEGSEEGAVSFVKLPAALAIGPGRGAAISIRLNDSYTVEIASDFQAETLGRLLDVLESRGRR
jgi:hypothetical protein